MAKKIEQLTADPSLSALRDQLVAAAQAFTDSAQSVGDLLRAMVDDVERAAAEPLEIFPVKHHSPASALHMSQRLRARPPKVIFMEGCEDLTAALKGLEHCKFPVALQAFAPEAPEFPPDWTPLNLVLPLTEFSAEYQAIAFCMEHPETKLVFVDRSADHVFQWSPRDKLPGAEDAETDDGGADADSNSEDEGAEAKDTQNLHGGAVGLRIGAMEPTFGDFLEVLLRNARVSHYSEWWSQYVEGPTLGADYATYRHVLFLVASLLRRVGSRAKDQGENEQRERYMWSRMRQWLREKKVDAKDAIHVCGAIHAVSPIPEFGVNATTEWEVPPRTKTAWLYGVVPSSYAAIEHQFGLPSGEIAIARQTWEKGHKAIGVEPFLIKAPSKHLAPTRPTKKTAATAAATPATTSKKPAPGTTSQGVATIGSVGGSAPSPAPAGPAAGPVAGPAGVRLHDLLMRPPSFVEGDDEQLMGWCVEVVRLARKNGYLSSTADTIAILHTSYLLARLRDRAHPSPYDFREAAITCLEKNRVPGKRNIARICDILLGGDKLGQVGYESLPPLAQDVYDRLAVLGVNLKASQIQRALLDFTARPDQLPASDLLWRLRYLGVPVVPVMGERNLGTKPKQESWDISIGKSQHSLIQLGYEGITVEQVLEKRLKVKAFAQNARTVNALEAAEDSVIYLKSGRLARELGLRAVELLKAEAGGADAPEIFQRVRRLVHYYRTVGLPDWIKEFVATGYQHYSTLLPEAFTDRGVTPQQLAAMLAFIFTQEALAFSVGCQRSQLLISVQQAAPEDAPKRALLWAAQWVLLLKSEDELRQEFTHLLSQPLLLPVFPEYVAGFLLALEFTPRITRLCVELMTRAFSELPEEVLVPWLPKLVVALRPLGPGVMSTLVKEAGLAFPRVAKELSGWQFPWERQAKTAAKPAPGPTAAGGAAVPEPPGGAAAPAPTGPALSPAEASIAAMLRAHPEPLDGIAARLGIDGRWAAAGAVSAGGAAGPTTGDAAQQGAAGEVSQDAASATAGATEDVHETARVLVDHPEAVRALAAWIGVA
ncbi:DUF5682 family protein [Chondromyces apiculatus]|uniref:Uncharacterized protein n=1 Tax=Chondromyces apiculatus DSM 436 TaxID=1192034 RepID=A0A017TJF3_9BACT|nr:DUF5682 family protein [Chondromyces apiculatus]EYF08761.1 Hypothetical protein CAP_2622 [Chondromyces apiculatus DSM 436]